MRDKGVRDQVVCGGGGGGGVGGGGGDEEEEEATRRRERDTESKARTPHKDVWKNGSFFKSPSNN